MVNGGSKNLLFTTFLNFLRRFFAFFDFFTLFETFCFFVLEMRLNFGEK